MNQKKVVFVVKIIENVLRVVRETIDIVYAKEGG